MSFSEDGKKHYYYYGHFPVLEYLRINGVGLNLKEEGETTANLTEIDRTILRIIHTQHGDAYTLVNSDKVQNLL